MLCKSLFLYTCQSHISHHSSKLSRCHWIYYWNTQIFDSIHGDITISFATMPSYLIDTVIGSSLGLLASSALSTQSLYLIKEFKVVVFGTLTNVQVLLLEFLYTTLRCCCFRETISDRKLIKTWIRRINIILLIQEFIKVRAQPMQLLILLLSGWSNWRSACLRIMP